MQLRSKYLQLTGTPFRVLALIVISLMILPAVTCRDAIAQADPFQHLRENVVKFELENGLRVLIYRRPTAPVFAGQTMVKVGGVNEVPGQTGISHFLEHMAFKGTEQIGTKDFAAEKKLLDRQELLLQREHDATEPKELEQLQQERTDVETKLEALWNDNEFSQLYLERGADGLNATTGKDFTHYTVSLPSVAFEFWCWIESERLLHPVFRQFYKEREVVLEERRSRFDTSPQGLLYETMISLAFLAHPNRLPVIGYKSDVEHLTVSQMQQFYATYYRPDNMVISLVGDLEPEKVRPVIEKYFGRIPKASVPLPQVVTVEPKQEGERNGIVQFEAEPSLLMAYHKPTYPDPDDAKFAVLHSLLSDGRSSLLEYELVQRRQIASSIATSEAPGILFPNLFYVAATPRRGVTATHLRDEIQKILNRLKSTKVSAEDLEAAKRRVRIDFLKALPSNDGLAEILAQCELLFGDWKAMFTSYEQILATSVDDIQRLAREYLNVESRTFVEIQTKERTQVVPSTAKKG